jgi:hypothetical protein
VKRDEVSLDIFWLKDGNGLDADLLNETAGNDALGAAMSQGST